MSRENVELARRAYEALNQGDDDAFTATLDAEVELVLPTGGLNEGTRRGPSDVRRFLESYADAFGELRMQPERFLDHGEKVVVLLRMTGQGRESGLDIDVRPLHVLTIREGRIRRVEAHTERERKAVLEALEEPGSG